ncbi:hypothetical protein HKCCE4037_04930 [Rhodobacterales bacterium HKCCE4037]|nr:hypothetical protein [Rhodobacterales bacterium HKCCE4037]
MSRSLMLEDFATTGPKADVGARPVVSVPVEEDDKSLEAYEAGYKSGWADCAAAEAEERKSVGAQLAQHLREAEMTYETARKDIFDALSPFFEEMVATLLPRLAAEALAPIASEQLRLLLEGAGDASVEILAAPSACESLQKLLDTEGLGSASVRSEPAYSESQVSIRVGPERRDIDLADVTEKIAEAVRAFQAQIEDPALAQGAA